MLSPQKQKAKEQSCSPLRFCVDIIGLVFSFLFALREGGHAPCEESWLVHASQPQSTHTLPCLVCHSVLIYNTREAPYVRHLRLERLTQPRLPASWMCRAPSVEENRVIGFSCVVMSNQILLNLLQERGILSLPNSQPSLCVAARAADLPHRGIFCNHWVRAFPSSLRLKCSSSLACQRPR